MTERCAPVMTVQNGKDGTRFILECPCGSPLFNRVVEGPINFTEAFILGHWRLL